MKMLFWMLVAGMLAGTMFAQMGAEEPDFEAEIKAEVDEYYEALDKDKDGKISKGEIKAYVKAQTGSEDETEFEFIQGYGGWLLDFLAADADDDQMVTRDEMTNLLKVQYSEDDKPALSKPDIKVLENEYYIPAAKAMIEQLDADKDGTISSEEAEAMGDAEGFAEVDTNGDGKVTRDELIKTIHNDTVEFYEVPEGVTVGEPDNAEDIEIPEQAKENFDSMDADGNGLISKSEMKKLAEGNDNTAFWWGLYASFVSMDTDDDGQVSLQEFARFGRDEVNKVKHKLYPSDKEAVLDEIWADLDANEDGKVSKEEFGKHFTDTSEYDGFDADEDGNVTRDEFWDGVFPNLGEQYDYIDKDKPRDNAESEGEADDLYAHYRKVGRTWTHKTTMKVQGMDPIVTYNKWEVLEVTDKAAKVKMTTMDKDKKETFSQEIEVSFTSFEGQVGEKVEESDETIEVEAGKFECTKVVINTITSWNSKKYPGLLVKYVSKINGGESTMELVEFKDGE